MLVISSGISVYVSADIDISLIIKFCMFHLSVVPVYAETLICSFQRKSKC